MEPKPVITYFGDVEILGSVLQKKLQARLSHLQVQSKDEGGMAFNSLCSGVDFQLFKTAREKAKSDIPFYRKPVLHTFWSGCSDAERYRSHDSPLIKQWLEGISSHGVSGKYGDHTPPMTLLIYCVTAEVRAKKQRPLAHFGYTSIDERLRTDYKSLVDDIVVFRLASSEESRLVESFQALIAKLNTMALTKFHKDIEAEKTAISRQRGIRSDPQQFYTNFFLRKLHLAVGHEVTVQNEVALSLYIEATTDLEEALTLFAESASPPQWLEAIHNAACTNWNYPKLAWTQLSWSYLQAIHKCQSPLLHTRTFLLTRVAHLFFVLERAWSVSELVINTLHCMAREIKMLKLTLPPGAFDCWAYMSCNEAIQAFMARFSPDSAESATSSLLLVRAQLWHYALQKLHDIGVLCGLMPSSNKLNHDKVLIKHISSGITPVSQDCIDPTMIGVSDEGQKLLTMLNDRQAFQNEFLVLGEMVIGAFKHAGRRRMAFRVGTLVAQFHRDLGLVPEAEQLLSDICKFYSEDQWTELSTKAYSLLADCQMKLRLEDKYVNTMLLLASFPPYPAASHDPVQWMSQLTRIAQRSPYQKLLNWEPLLELVRLETVNKRDAYSLQEEVEMDLVIKLHGPKEMKSLIATMQTKLAGSLHILSASSPNLHTTPHRATNAPISNTPTKDMAANMLQNMEDLDLKLNSKQLPHSRPIGGSSKARSTSHLITHISHATIAELEAGWHEEGVKGRELGLLAFNLNLKTGENRVRLKGKGVQAGEYAPHKISLKFGSLDFVYTVAPKEAKDHVFVIQDPQINVDIALAPDEGVFLGGLAQQCELSFITGANMSIPELAPVRVVVSKDIQMEIHTSPPPSVQETDAGTVEHRFTLPALSADTSHDCHMTLKLPAHNTVHTELQDVQDQAEKLPAWRYTVEVYCEWLSPCYVASLHLDAYQPLSLTCLEHSAGEGSSFLQLLLKNTSPLPLMLKDPHLDTHLSLDPLHGNLPQVFFPLESYSFLWRVKTAPPVIQGKMESSFKIEYSLLPLNFDWNVDEVPATPTFLSTHFPLLLSNMQTVFEVKVSMEAEKEHVWVTLNQPATLRYTIHNVMEPPPQETQFGTTPTSVIATPTSPTMEFKLGYKVCLDKVWSLCEGSAAQSRGVMAIPAPNESQTLQFHVVPHMSGTVPLPSLLLKWLPGEGGASRGEGVAAGGCVLTAAQVYNLSYEQVVNVHLQTSDREVN